MEICLLWTLHPRKLLNHGKYSSQALILHLAYHNTWNPVDSSFEIPIVMEITLDLIFTKCEADLRCLANQNKPDNDQWYRVSHPVYLHYMIFFPSDICICNYYDIIAWECSSYGLPFCIVPFVITLILGLDIHYIKGNTTGQSTHESIHLHCWFSDWFI